jgi:hypothetical protein
MNNRARHAQYRKSLYRKKRVKAIALISAVVLVALFILFLIIGNILHKKTEQNAPGKNNSQQSTETDTGTSTIPTANTVGAYALPLLEDGSNFSDRLASIPNNAESVCIALNTTDGTLLYRSELSSSLPYLSFSGDATSLSGSISRIKERGLYVTAILYVPSFGESNDLLRDVYLTSWCSVAVESIRSGVGDCLLAPRSASSDDVEKICELAALIREIEPKATVGCLLPGDVIGAENSEVLIDKLSKNFSYLCLNTTDHKEDEDVENYVSSKITNMQMQLIYYKMRVLLPHSPDTATQQKYIDVAKKYNITSWQIKP